MSITGRLVPVLLLFPVSILPFPLSAPAQPAAFSKRTFVYKEAAGVRIEADVHRTDDDTVRPALVWIHGGALVMGNRTMIPQPVLDLCREDGYALVSIDYRLAPEVKIPAIAEDVADAWRWAAEKGPALFRIDPERMALAGESAGGYLTLLAGPRAEPRPLALVAYYGYGDIAGDWYAKPSPHYLKSPRVEEADARKGVGGAVRSNVLWGAPAADGRVKYYFWLRQTGRWPLEVAGIDPAATPEALVPWCPERLVTPWHPPVMLLHGTDDSDVPHEQSAAMAEALTRQGAPHEFVSVPGAGHGLSGDGDVAAAHARAREFLRRRLRPVFPVRGWDIERFDPPYVIDRLREAARHGINTVTFSHEIVMNAEEILHDWHRYKHLRTFCAEARRLGMASYLWNHQVNNPPEEMVTRDADGLEWLDFDSPRLAEWLRDRYRQVAARVPEADGIVLSLTESGWQVHRGPHEPFWGNLGTRRIRSRHEPHERMARVIRTMRDALAESGKRLIVRDFFRSPGELESFVKAMETIPADVGVYTKCVPNDWQYRYPPHPLLGRFPGRMQVMELDIYNETSGNARTAMLTPDYYQRQIQMARDRGLAGVIPRIDDGFGTTRGTVREFNLFAYNRLIHDPDSDTGPMWTEFFEAYCGDPEAARAAVACYRRTEEILCGIAYTLGFWTGFGVEYTDSRLAHHRSTLWSDDPAYADIERLLTAGGAEAVRRTVEEKQRAEALAEQSLRELDAAEARLRPETFREMRGHFEELAQRARIGAQWVRAYYSLRGWRNRRDDASRREVEAALVEARGFLAALPREPRTAYQRTLDPEQFRSFLAGRLEEGLREIEAALAGEP